SATVSLTVTPPPTSDFSINASPASLSIPQGGSGTSTISTAVVSGSAGTVGLRDSGAPSGAPASLHPTSGTAGGRSTLTVNTWTAPCLRPVSSANARPSAPATCALTFSPYTALHPSSATVSLTVTPPPTSDFSISASPASLSLPQGASGTSTISTAVVSGSAG